MDFKCFGLKECRVASPTLLILADRLCFGRYKIDFHVAAVSRIFFPRDLEFRCNRLRRASIRTLVGPLRVALVQVSVPPSGAGAAIYRAVWG